jgi:hypothetical protein
MFYVRINKIKIFNNREGFFDYSRIKEPCTIR